MSKLFYKAESRYPFQFTQKVMLATTVYDTPCAAYVYSIQKSREALHLEGIATEYLLLQGNCHVDDGRNVVVQHFLLSDCTDLIFLDADVSWEPEHLITLAKADADLCGGVYPYRREGQNEKMPVILMPDAEMDEKGRIEALGLPTGFMKINRKVLEALAEDADHFPNKAETRSKVPLLFERTFDEGARWGGDITFCKKWAKKGGKLYALPLLRLGHSGDITLVDSLDAAMRRKEGTTIKNMVERVRNNDFNIQLFLEVLKAEGNPYSALEDVLMLCALMGKKADGPILEAGSGITSIVLAAATNHQVYSLEHDPYWAEKTRKMAEDAGVMNLRVVDCNVKDGWYDIKREYFPRLSLGLNDGPPRQIGNRGIFFEKFGDIPTIIVDDADDMNYREAMDKWAESNHRRLDYIERSALIRMH